MKDADKNSKSLVLITRVGSTPTTGIEKPTERYSQSAFLFIFPLYIFVFSGKMLTMALAEDTLLEKSRCV